MCIRDRYRGILRRLCGVNDLIAINARYHAECLLRIKNEIKNSSMKLDNPWSKVSNAMEEVFKYIEENDDCQFTLRELRNVITSEYVPDERTIKKRLEENYKDEIVISNKFGKSSIVCFKKKENEILTAKWYQERLQDDTQEEFRILKAAAEIIRRHIRGTPCDKEHYPASDQMFTNINDCIPEQLTFFFLKK